ncbi:hypothetical protein [Alteriqipengyuania sp. 357]
MRTISLFATAALIALAGCSISQTGQDDDAAEGDSAGTQQPGTAGSPIPVEPDGGIGDGAPPLEDMVLGQEEGEVEEPSAFAKTFPVAIRGKWRETSGAKPTAAQCDGYKQDNMGKVLTVREDSYSFFETGGHFIAISDRAPGHIRAVYDTTYADEPTRDELEFRVDPVKRTLTVENFDAGEKGTTVYRRCAAE